MRYRKKFADLPFECKEAEMKGSYYAFLQSLDFVINWGVLEHALMLSGSKNALFFT